MEPPSSSNYNANNIQSNDGQTRSRNHHQRGRSWRPRGGFRGRRNNFRQDNYSQQHDNNNLNSQEQIEQTQIEPNCNQSNDYNNHAHLLLTDDRPNKNLGPRFDQQTRPSGRGQRRIRPTNYSHHHHHQNNEFQGEDNQQSNDYNHQNEHNNGHPHQHSSRGARGRFRNPRNILDNNNRKGKENDTNPIDRPTTSRVGGNNSPLHEIDESNAQCEIAEKQLKTNNFECMICCDNISRYNPIWCCNNCYNIFHLKCAIEWCNKSIKSRNEAIANSQYPSLSQAPTSSSANSTNISTPTTHNPQMGAGYADYQNERMTSVEWPCPACREVLYSRPGKYKCFCGKVIRPEVNKHLTPHSCGQLCARKRPNIDCPHKCNTICHPGRCAPCLLSSKRTCHCGKVDKEVKCSIGSFSCDEVCAKPLTCGIHYCDRVCHEGSCSPCEEIIMIKCHCGSQETPKLCPEYNALMSSGSQKEVTKLMTCSKVCGRQLDCGKHFCNDKCHPGPNCPSCKFLSQNIRTCPCGSTLIKKSLLTGRKSCIDPVPTCDNKCNRSLICGPDKNRHKCQKKCHMGPCPPCKLKTTAYCSCGLSTKTIECNLMYEKVENGDQVCFKQVEFTFTCEARCNKPKSCGRHRCNNKCCKAIKSPNSPLHKCDQICNKKLPCGQHNCPEVCHPNQCGDCTNIGWEELRCHCGGSVMYPPIPCGAKTPACHRPCRRPHNCGHPVKHECHDASEACSPCTVFVKKSCFCGSESKDSVYCYLNGYSCGRTCKKMLVCKQHRCQRVCHDKDCETPNNKGAYLCNQPCPVTRYLCKHPCAIPCHGKTPCPIAECRKILEITCECGNKMERIECHRAMRDVENRNMVAMLSTSRSNQEGIIIDLSKKLPAKQGTENTNADNQLKKLDCDETCSVLKRNKALAEALEIVQPDLKPTSIFGDDPLRLLKEATVQDYKFVSATFNSLAKFVKTAKESERRFIFMQFPPAEKLRREVVHELAHHFNCTSESDGEEPFRHVVVRAYKNKSMVPDFTIEQLLPVTD